jgi:O-antigen/teichoic acid export membrane protein
VSGPSAPDQPEALRTAEREDILSTPEAGPKAIRGGVIRSAGYAAGVVLALISAPLLTRHLGVTDFGRYVTVVSITTIVALVADAGLTVVGVREYATREPAGRRRLMRNLVALRLGIATIGSVVAVGFVVVAGYEAATVAGTALAAFGTILMVAQQSYTVPLVAQLRMGTVTVLELLRQTLMVIGIVVGIVVGAGVVVFLALSIPVGVVVGVVTLLAVRGMGAAWPGLDGDEWRALLADAVPVAAASILAALFYRVAIIETSLLSSAEETGYFSLSFRVIEVILPIPSMITATAFPILARAADGQPERLAYGLQRLFEIAVILGGATVLGLAFGAEPAIEFLGGDEFAPAVDVLRIQGIATAATFLFAVWAAGLWAVRAQRPLLVATVIGVAAVGALTAILAPAHGAIGAAIAATIAEVVLAAACGVFLFAREPELRPRLGVVPKVLAALAAAGALWFTGLPAIPLTILGVAVYAAVLLVLRAIPADVADALLSRLRRAQRP